jgi:acetolactate synthase regulatory subunit
MEIILRCAVPDRPGALAELAGVIGACGCDIEAVDVVDVVEGRALDDLVVVVDGPRHLRTLLDELAGIPDVEVVHAAPSRGHPGDAVTRLAVKLESMMSGAMEADHAVTTLVGGLLRADDITLAAREDAPAEAPGTLVIPYGGRSAVVRRSYPFTATERNRAVALVRVCAQAAPSSGAAKCLEPGEPTR